MTSGPQFHDLLILLVGIILGAVAAHFHPGTVARRKRVANATKTAEKAPRKSRNNPRRAEAATKPPAPDPGPSLPME